MAEILRMISGDVEKSIRQKHSMNCPDKFFSDGPSTVMLPFRPRIRKQQMKCGDGGRCKKMRDEVGRVHVHDPDVGKIKAGRLAADAADTPG